MEFRMFHCLTIHELGGRMYVTGYCLSPLIFPQKNTGASIPPHLFPVLMTILEKTK